MVGTLIEIQLSADDFALAHTFQTLQDTTVEIKPVVVLKNDPRSSFIWVDSTDREMIDSAFIKDVGIENFHFITSDSENHLHRIEWNTRIKPLMQSIVEKSAVILSAVEHNGIWIFTVLFNNNRNIYKFLLLYTERNHTRCQYCKAIPTTLKRTS